MKVVWTRTARETFLAETDFILRKWNSKQVKAFILLVDESIRLLSSGIVHGRLLNSNHFRLVISKQTSLYYFIEDDKLVLQVFWNNKQDPEKLRKLLK